MDRHSLRVENETLAGWIELELDPLVFLPLTRDGQGDSEPVVGPRRAELVAYFGGLELGPDGFGESGVLARLGRPGLELDGWG
jgi:hypothetical protein